ncbi:MAG: AAA family ATPase, partial [Phycisphaerales bacterium]|nr:AAA family ATPase [Phycisphaerales bacterium]
MAKDRPVFHCRACGSTHPRWLGRCPDCGAWDALEQGTPGEAPPVRAVRLADVEEVPDVARLRTGMPELDRVLGGGLVPGSVVLIGGEPGIGKSTLLLQAGGAIASRTSALYVTSEESLGQVRSRAGRLGVADGSLFVLADTNLARVVEQIRTTKAKVVV